MNIYSGRYTASQHDRQSRLLWTLTAVVIINVPHFLHVPPWVTATLIAACLWRYLLEVRKRKLPSAWVRVPLVFAAFAAVLASYRGISGIEAGSALLIIMLALKLLETKQSRDLTVVTLIGWFLMFSVLLREQEMWAIPYILLGSGLALAALIQTRRAGPVLKPAILLRQTAVIMLQAAPIMIALFLLFPRIESPFWALPTAGSSARTGLSDTVNPGDISSLSQSDAIAFRVTFDGAVPPPADRYWRGPVMGYFDGRQWSWGDRGLRASTAQRSSAEEPVYTYELTLEPHGRQWLLALETPLNWSDEKAFLTLDLQLIASQSIGQRIAYQARSQPRAPSTRSELPRYLGAMKFLPQNSNPKTLQLARQLRSESVSDSDFIDKVLSKFRTEEFFYTLTPQRLGANPVDEFLFGSREGFCEHYASALAVMARAAGIPSRVVTGYLGAEQNPLADYWIVRQSDAHAWTEIWLNRRWVRVDPTAAVAPERIEYGLEEALSDADITVGRAIMGTTLISQALLSWDLVNAYWNRWVLAFGPEAQQLLLGSIGIKEPSKQHLIIFMIVALSIIIAILAWYLRVSITPVNDPVRRYYDEFCRRLQKAGLIRRPDEGPATFSSRVGQQRPDLRAEVGIITHSYLQLRYENFENNAAQTDFISRVKRFRPRQRKG